VSSKTGQLHSPSTIAFALRPSHNCAIAMATEDTLAGAEVGRLLGHEIVARSAGVAPSLWCDNGPELTANALRDWCRLSRAGSAYIEPGSRWQNPYIESFGSGLRDELLAVELCSSLTEAQVLIEDWRQDYNHRRPHSALGMMTPSAFSAGYRTYLEAVSEHLSPLGGSEQWLAGTTTTTISSHSRWTDERGPVRRGPRRLRPAPATWRARSTSRARRRPGAASRSARTAARTTCSWCRCSSAPASSKRCSHVEEVLGFPGREPMAVAS
jgi:hypothetical protein